MSAAGDPTRWLDAISPGAEGDEGLLGDVLRAGRSELPSEERLGAIWAGLSTLPPGGGPSDGGPSEGGPDGGPSDAGPLDGGPLEGGGGDIGFGPGIEPGLGMATAGGAASGLKIAAAKFALVAAVGAAAVGVPTYFVTREPPMTAAVQPSAAGPTIATEAAAASPPLDPALPDIAESASAAEPVVPSPEPAAPASPKRSEIELLQDAQGALGSHPARALALVAEAAALHPNGALGQEREMIRMQALVGMGRRAEAVALARAFRDRHPQSPHVRRLEALFPELVQP